MSDLAVLNIAAGKFDPILPQDTGGKKFILNVDTSYFDKTNPVEVEVDLRNWKNSFEKVDRKMNLNMNVFEFMERTSHKFDHVSIYRFLEHVSFTQVEYFIYLVSTITEPGAFVDVIVPDYTILAEMILNESKAEIYNDYDKFHNHNIMLTTELLNEPSCPHASIWTRYRMKRFWELENRFRLSYYKIGYEFDGRDIYLRAMMKRI